MFCNILLVQLFECGVESLPRQSPTRNLWTSMIVNIGGIIEKVIQAFVRTSYKNMSKKRANFSRWQNRGNKDLNNVSLSQSFQIEIRWL